MRVRLGVRVQLAGHLRGPPPPLRGLGVPAGQLQVVGDRRGPGRGRVPLVPPGQDVRRPAVQQPAPGQRGRLVGGPAQRLVGEPVGGRLARGGRGDLGQQRPGQRLVDRLDDLVLASPADRAQQVRVVVAAEHRGRGQHLPGRLADRLQPGPQQVPDAGGRPPVGLLEPQGALLGGVPGRPQRLDVLADQHGQPARLGHQPVHLDLRHPVQVQQRADRLRPEQPRLDHLAHRLVLGLAERGAQHPQPSGLLVLPAQHQQQRPVGQPPHQVGEQPERRAVRPLHVLHHDHPGRPLGCPRQPQDRQPRNRQPRDRARNRPPRERLRPGSRPAACRRSPRTAGSRPPGCPARARPSPGGPRPGPAPGARPSRPSAPGAPRADRAAPRARSAAGPRPARTAARSRRRGSGRPAPRPPAALRRLGPELGDQPRFPAAGLPGDRHHPARRAGRLPGRAQPGQLGLSPHQRPDPGRASNSGAAAAPSAAEAAEAA